jgi:hypothetical protein
MSRWFRYPSIFVVIGLVSLMPARVRAQRCVAPSDRADRPSEDRWCGTDLITGLGGPAGFGPMGQCLSPNDDGSSRAIDITPYFPGGLRFFDRTHTRLYVNTNGNITFSGPLATYTPRAFPVADQPMIAPFWADVDIRFTDGRCMGSAGRTCEVCEPCHNPTENGVWWYFEPARGSSRARAIFTWDEVGYYSCHMDRRQSFQLILTEVRGCGSSSSTDFDVEFRFNRCEWDTGDASGGTGGFLRSTGFGAAAQSGFDAGNSRDFVEIMGSRMTREINRRLCEESNVGMPGVWRFSIRSGVVMCPDAGRPCTVPGQLGACAEGRTNCVGGGTECVQQVMPTPERCDAIDNDCDGMTDEEDSGPLCPGLATCRGGTCVDTCFEGGCPDGFTCTPSGCIESACVGVSCPEGQRCSGGRCVAACDGIVCPEPLACVAGRCVDVCAGLSCDECTVCEDGTCVLRCQYASCDAGETCTMEGRCVETACVGVTCGPGTYCRGGRCVDACEGARCPPGEICRAGACVPDVRDAGMPAVDGGSPGIEDAGGGGEPTDAGGGSGEVDAGRRPPEAHRGGCCTVGPGAERGHERGALLVALGVLALVIVRARRR